MPDGFFFGTIHASFACDKINVVRFYCPFNHIFLSKMSSDIVANVLCDLPDNLTFKETVRTILQI